MSTPIPEPRPLLDVADIARLTGTSPRYARALLDRRALPVVKLGHLVRVKPADLDAWIEANTRPAQGDA